VAASGKAVVLGSVERGERRLSVEVLSMWGLSVERGKGSGRVAHRRTASVSWPPSSCPT
jgi:hypothetical protein